MAQQRQREFPEGTVAENDSDELDSIIAKEGISYAVRYIGCLEVKTSIKQLNFKARSQVTKQCIRRVCEAAGLKTASSKSSSGASRENYEMSQLLGDRPRMEHAGSDVNLTVYSGYLVLSELRTGQVIVQHDMPRISFASGGDTDTLDFVAYIAKNSQEWRACYVLECGGRLAQKVIATIGQAFTLRYMEFRKKNPGISLPMSGIRNIADIDYYNDLPGKVPPEVGPTPPVPPLPFTNVSNFRQSQHNLIDLHAPEPLPVSLNSQSAFPDHNYVNYVHLQNQNQHLNPKHPTSQPDRDVFDMHPFTNHTIDASTQRAQLWGEVWYHGVISRAEAEALLMKDGDFLVRESLGASGQYVLTGMQDNNKKHLLLIDPEGAVRTKDRMFENVSHLIKYHCENQLPIISAESTLVLRTPVPRSIQCPD